jgi:hypothetical protein
VKPESDRSAALVFLLFDLDGFRYALGGRLPDQVMVLLRDFVKLDNGQQLVFVVFENFRTKLVAVAVAHALTVDADFHFSLLLASAGRLASKIQFENNPEVMAVGFYSSLVR